MNCNDKAFNERLSEALSEIAITENDTPEHNFLIGLAYLDGIDVEVDRERATELIAMAAESEMPEAMMKLYMMYSEGQGTQLDYRKAVKWIEKLVAYNKNNSEKNIPIPSIPLIIWHGFMVLSEIIRKKRN